MSLFFKFSNVYVNVFEQRVLYSFIGVRVSSELPLSHEHAHQSDHALQILCIQLQRATMNMFGELVKLWVCDLLAL